MNSIEFSVIIPVYNSVATLQPLFEGIKATMTEMKKTFEVIFVEDYGSKGSWEELLKLKNRYPNELTIIKLSRNFGQNGATVCGIDQSKGRKIITIDDDLQIHPREIEKLIENQENNAADVVFGNYKGTTSIFRKIGAKTIKWIFNRSQGGASIGSSFRLIDRHIVERLKFHSQDHLFINQVINWYTLNYQFVEVEHQKRENGSSGYSIFNLVFLAIRLLFYYTNIPLRITIYSCILAFICCLGLTGYYYFHHFYRDGDFDFLTIILILGLALILGSISVLGVYINRIYTSRVKRPNYAIKYKI
jgi:undecaprenyl-phosphate 4-deoxy-4-formamido-L-arabinose transferase